MFTEWIELMDYVMFPFKFHFIISFFCFLQTHVISVRRLPSGGESVFKSLSVPFLLLCQKYGRLKITLMFPCYICLQV